MADNPITLTFSASMAPVMAKAFRLAARSGEFAHVDAVWLDHWAEDMEAVGRD